MPWTPDRATLPAATLPAADRPCPHSLRHGRGAVDEPARTGSTGRASRRSTTAGRRWREFAELPPLSTTLTRDATRSAISWNQSPDIGFDRAVNPYRGCEHGCVYCYARPTHAYLGYSPGLDFETKLLFKPDIAELLEKELRKPGYVPRHDGAGLEHRSLPAGGAHAGADARGAGGAGALRPSASASSPSPRACCATSTSCKRLAARNLVRVHCRSPRWTRRSRGVMEPRAATPARRLAAVAALTRQGVPVSRARRADDPRPQRRGAGEHPGGGGEGGGARGRLYPVAPAATS